MRPAKMIEYWELIGGAELMPWQKELLGHVLTGNRDAVYRAANRRELRPATAEFQAAARQFYGERHPATGLVVCFLPVAGWIPAFDRTMIMTGLVKL